MIDLPQLFASFASLSPSIRWAIGRPDEADLKALSELERARVADAGARRRAEFATSRRLAHELLAAFGVGRPSGGLLSDADRVPCWPPGLVGSISHCQEACVVAVAPAGEVGSLGVDVEVAAPLPSGVASLVVFAPDAPFLASFPDGPDPAPEALVISRAVAERVLFSAKEAAYKALFPRCRVSFDFDGMVIAHSGPSSPGANAGSLVATLQLELPKARKGLDLHGYFVVQGGLVVTAFAEPPAAETLGVEGIRAPADGS